MGTLERRTLGADFMKGTLQLRSVDVGHGGDPLVANINLDLEGGQCVALIGVNGGGKSTLLNTMAGLRPPMAGRIYLGGTEIDRLSSAERARSVSVVFTGRPQAGLLDVRTIVGLGRQPWTGHFGGLNEGDESVIEEAMRIMGVHQLGSRSLQHLSDGEAQRVMIARALAQDTPLLLLDEPMAFLDLVNRVRLLRTLRDEARARNRLVILSTHDLQTSLDLCDRVLLIHDRRLWSGTVVEARASGILERVFADEGIRFDPATGSFRPY